MTAKTLALFSRPEFPQDALTNFEPLDPFSAMLGIVDQVLDEAKAPLCIWESPESSKGACDGGHPCKQIAVFGDYCKEHFQESESAAGEVADYDPEATAELDLGAITAALRFREFQETIREVRASLMAREFPQSLKVGDEQ